MCGSGGSASITHLAQLDKLLVLAFDIRPLRDRLPVGECEGQAAWEWCVSIFFLGGVVVLKASDGPRVVQTEALYTIDAEVTL